MSRCGPLSLYASFMSQCVSPLCTPSLLSPPHSSVLASLLFSAFRCDFLPWPLVCPRLGAGPLSASQPRCGCATTTPRDSSTVFTPLAPAPQCPVPPHKSVTHSWVCRPRAQRPPAARWCAQQTATARLLRTPYPTAHARRGILCLIRPVWLPLRSHPSPRQAWWYTSRRSLRAPPGCYGLLSLP